MLLLLNILLVPTLIALLTLAGRRWGPTVAGWLSGFPVVAGPLLLMIGIEQGPLFAAQAAKTSLSAVLANLSFSIAYSWGAPHFRWYVCLFLGMLGFAAAGTLLTVFPLPLWTALIVTLVGLLAAPYLFPRTGAFAPPSGAPSALELPVRMIAGAVLCVSVTMFARRVGPTFSGLFSVFPVVSLVFAVFSHLTWGAAGTIKLLSGMVRGFFAFAVFCLAVALAVPGWGLGAGFLAALACALPVQAASFRRPN